MSSRISVKYDLEPIVARLNRMVGMDPDAPLWSQDPNRTDRHIIATIGMYHLDGAYGGWSLHLMETTGGGIKDVLGIGHVPARELQGAMFAYIQGLQDAETRREKTTA